MLQLNDDDYYTLKRYQDFRAAAECVAAAFAGQPAVRRVALFGSVAPAPRLEAGRRGRGHFHDPKDVDVAVWLDGATDLDRLRKRFIGSGTRSRLESHNISWTSFCSMRRESTSVGCATSIDVRNTSPNAESMDAAHCRFSGSMTGSSSTVSSRCIQTESTFFSSGTDREEFFD